MIIEVEITTRLSVEEWKRSGRLIPWETRWQLDTGALENAQIAEAFECLHEALRQAGWRPDPTAKPDEDDAA